MQYRKKEQEKVNPKKAIGTKGIVESEDNQLGVQKNKWFNWQGNPEKISFSWHIPCHEYLLSRHFQACSPFTKSPQITWKLRRAFVIKLDAEIINYFQYGNIRCYHQYKWQESCPWPTWKEISMIGHHRLMHCSFKLKESRTMNTWSHNENIN